MADGLDPSSPPDSGESSSRPGEAGLLSGGYRLIFDSTTVFGILGAAVLMAVAIWLGGNLGAFFDLPSVLIVLGGTVLLTTASFTWVDISHVSADLGKALTPRRRRASDAAKDILRIADFARRHGVLQLQGAILESLRSEAFLYKGLQLVVDGLADAEIEQMLRQEMMSQRARAAKSADVLRRAAEIAPAMGLIGTLIGLVQMLGHLDDPSVIGPGMAVALLTTFYGACLANVVLTPLASKLEHNAVEEAMIQRIHILGVLSVERKDNPRRLEMQINSVLPPGGKVRFFD